MQPYERRLDILHKILCQRKAARSFSGRGWGFLGEPEERSPFLSFSTRSGPFPMRTSSNAAQYQNVARPHLAIPFLEDALHHHLIRSDLLNYSVDSYIFTRLNS